MEKAVQLQHTVGFYSDKSSLVIPFVSHLMSCLFFGKKELDCCSSEFFKGRARLHVDRFRLKWNSVWFTVSDYI